MEGVGIEKIVKKLQLKKYIEDMELKGHRIRLADVNRPALQLSGYFEHFEQSRVQIIGMVEYTYLQHLNDSEKDSIYSRFLKYDIPCVIFCRIYSRMTCSYRGQRKIIFRYSEQAEAHQNSWRS